jgi:hypothetical protein
MTLSIALYTILFTLEDKTICKNKYVDMFIMWFCLLLKSDFLDENDIFFLVVDKHTRDFLFNHTVFLRLCRKIKFKINFTNFISQPKTLLEGCMLKYTNYNQIVDCQKDVIMYTDIDVLLVKSIKYLINQMAPNSIIINEEATNKEYTIDIPKSEMEEIVNYFPNYKGLSAGKFIVYGKQLYCDLCIMINDYNKIKKTDYYTLEQPFFNRAVYNKAVKKELILQEINSSIVQSENYDNTNNNTLIVDCCGGPGEQDPHYERILDKFLLILMSEHC